MSKILEQAVKCRYCGDDPFWDDSSCKTCGVDNFAELWNSFGGHEL